MKKLTTLILFFLASATMGAAVYMATAYYLGYQKANRLPGGAVSAGLIMGTCSNPDQPKSHRLLIAITTLIGGIAGHCFMIWMHQ